ncbi:hypothetical protein HPB49_004915 [Dermacentor silvarum]|uniref:Uncharacterized protein n=1 Tax=Dermacentor silvarum TaxID=543639 RepID=A0ACB8DUF9_DERSI|nr:hypothetical protein HPB49_004915 [Dermacentor silvarum]
MFRSGELNRDMFLVIRRQAPLVNRELRDSLDTPASQDQRAVEEIQACRDLSFLDHREYQDPGDKTVNEATRVKRGHLENRDSPVSLDSKAKEVLKDNVAAPLRAIFSRRLEVSKETQASQEPTDCQAFPATKASRESTANRETMGFRDSRDFQATPAPEVSPATKDSKAGLLTTIWMRTQ